MSQDQQKAIWKKQSSRWEHVGLPTRPTREDGQLMLEMATASPLNESSSAAIIILGVTPEVVQLPWPAGSSLQAFDISAEMIGRVWRPHPGLKSAVSQARWQSLPVMDATADIVAGDGCLTALQGMTEGQEVLTEVARVLKPRGRFIMRCFIRPPVFENLDAIVADVEAGNIEHFGTLKWRLAMALCDSDSSTVRPSNISGTFNRLFPDRDQLQKSTGWRIETIGTIDAYDDMCGLFTFMTLPQLQQLTSPCFNIESVNYGGYELSERCPTITLTLA